MAALVFEAVSKHYRGTRPKFGDDVSPGVARLIRRREPRPIIKALDDVSFSIAEGESFALLGHNGAGKTTALKLATRVTYPTTGRVRIRGRVGSLIEVGTGLHPELTGRENIHLYGSFMGLSRLDIQTRFDEIVDFAGISAALSQPLKQYSSGMQLRLGFSVAAFLEPDVLLVDEAISVGDAQFQAKCVARMQDLTAEGRTLVFVSHDMYAVEALCNRAVWLRGGQVVGEGTTRQVIEAYLRSVGQERVSTDPTTGTILTDSLDIVRVSLHDSAGEEIEVAESGRPLTVRLHYNAKGVLRRPGFSIGIGEGGPHCLAIASMVVDDQAIPEAISGEGVIDCRFGEIPLQPRPYELWASVRTADGYSDYIPWQRLLRLEVAGEIEGSGPQALTAGLTEAPVKLKHSWSTEDRE